MGPCGLPQPSPAGPARPDPGPRTPFPAPAPPAPCQVRPCSPTLTFRRPWGAAPARRESCGQQQRQQHPSCPGTAAARDPHGRRGCCRQRRRRAGKHGGDSGRCVRAPCPLRSDTPGPAPPGPRAPASFSHGPPRPGRAARGQCRPYRPPFLPPPGLGRRGRGRGGPKAAVSLAGAGPNSPHRPWHQTPLLSHPRPSPTLREPCAPPAYSVLQLDPVPFVRTNRPSSLKYSATGHPGSVLCSSESCSPQAPKPPTDCPLGSGGVWMVWRGCHIHLTLRRTQ